MSVCQTAERRGHTELCLVVAAEVTLDCHSTAKTSHVCSLTEGRHCGISHFRLNAWLRLTFLHLSHKFNLLSMFSLVSAHARHISTKVLWV